MELSVKKLPKSEVEIQGELPPEALEKERPAAIKKLTKNLNIPGFRKGHIPDKVALEHIGDSSLLYEMADLAIKRHYSEIIEKSETLPIGIPQVNITKLALGNPLGFTIRLAVLPTFTLPNIEQILRSLPKDTESTDPTADEINEAVDRLRRQAATIKGGDTDKEVPLPELTDTLVGEFGGFKTVAEFKEKLTEQIKHDKEHKKQERTRLSMIDALIRETSLDVPSILVEAELDGMEANFKSYIENIGLKAEDYLQSIGKELSSLRDEWKGDAEKRAKMHLLLSRIAEEKNLNAGANDVEAEVKKILSKDSSHDRASITRYVEGVLTNQKVFQYLEDLVNKK